MSSKFGIELDTLKYFLNLQFFEDYFSQHIPLFKVTLILWVMVSEWDSNGFVSLLIFDLTKLLEEVLEEII